MYFARFRVRGKLIRKGRPYSCALARPQRRRRVGDAGLRPPARPTQRGNGAAGDVLETDRVKHHPGLRRLTARHGNQASHEIPPCHRHRSLEAKGERLLIPPAIGTWQFSQVTH